MMSMINLPILFEGTSKFRCINFHVVRFADRGEAVSVDGQQNVETTELTYMDGQTQTVLISFDRFKAIFDIATQNLGYE